MSPPIRPAWAEIDLDAVKHNVLSIRELLSRGCRYMAVVKANAYGHGDILVARAAREAGAEWLGVILVEEARRLRRAGIEAPILLLHEPPVAQAPDVKELDLVPTVVTQAGLEALAAQGPMKVHVKVETGLNRLGVPRDALPTFAKSLAAEPNIEVDGVYSHFAVADPVDDPSIAMQLKRFDEAIEVLRHAGIEVPMKHIGNSATALSHPEAHMDMVRVGISTYGIAPAPTLENVVDLHPVLSLKARVAMVKRVAAGEGISYGLHYRLNKASTIATLPLGYADGWPRRATGATYALINERPYPIVGTICMDAFMVDLGDDDCSIGDEAVLIGTQGQYRITASDVATALGTIPYEVVTQISPRVERVAVGT
ncbi:MAG: alanine racemase [Actinomycetota bacterium]